MSYSLYKCDSKNCTANLNFKYQVEVFKPTLFKPFLEGYTKTLADKFIYLYWLLISCFDLAIYYVKDGNQIIHTSLVTGKSFKFPFMSEYDWHIGPCITKQEYRGQGIYPYVLCNILQEHASIFGGTNYMIIENDNTPSSRGVIKAGFEKISAIFKNKTGFFYKYEQPIEGWQYYNHAAIPTKEPKRSVNIKPIENGSIWTIDGNKPLFVRYTSDFDCGYETEWWHIIKDSKYEPEKLPSIKRRHIRKGRENFITKVITPINYITQLANVCEDAFLDYPEAYRPNFDKVKYSESIRKGSLSNNVVFASFDNITNELSGFLVAEKVGMCIDLKQLKVKREAEKKKVNFALIDAFLTYYNNMLEKNYYIFNNERNIVHDTNFPEFLCKYFGFRKTYCKLHMVYNPLIKPYIYILFLFRRYIKSISHKHPLLYKISAVLEMERIARKCRHMK